MEAVWRIVDNLLYLATSSKGTGSCKITGGACDLTAPTTLARARNEAVERWTLKKTLPESIQTQDEVLKRGIPTSTSMAEFSNDHCWLIGTGYENELIAVPARAVLLGWTDGRSLQWRQSSVGTSIHYSRKKAIEIALMECIERYAVRNVWRGKLAIRETPSRTNLLPEQLWNKFDSQKVHVKCWEIETVFDTEIILAAIARTDRQQITFGAAARRIGNKDQAIKHAILEAISVRAALSGNIKQNGTKDIEQIRHRAVTEQEKYLEFLASCSNPGVVKSPPSADNALDTASALAQKIKDTFQVAPAVISIRLANGLYFSRVCILHEEFLCPRIESSGYIINPGYLE